MRKMFWTTISVLLLLVFTAVIIQMNQEEVIVETPPNIVEKIDLLQNSVKEMQAEYETIQQIRGLSLAIGKSASANNWMSVADEKLKALKQKYNDNVLTIYNDLISQSLTDPIKKLVGEAKDKAAFTISIEFQRDILLAKNKLGISVPSSKWNELADEIQKVTDKFDRSLELKNLAETVAANKNLSSSIFNRIDAPFVKNLAMLNSNNNLSVENILSGVTEPFLQLELLIAIGKKNRTDDVRLSLTGIIEKFTTPTDKAYVAARILKSLPDLPVNDREAFLEIVRESGNPLLEADCLMSLVESGKLGHDDFHSFAHKTEEVAATIPENHPRELIEFRVIKAEGSHKHETLENLIAATEKLHSVTLREQAYTLLAMFNVDLPEEEFNKIVAKMDDPYSRLNSKLAWLDKASPDSLTAARFLEGLEGEAAAVKIPETKICFFLAWAKVDPYVASIKIAGISNIRNKVEAASKYAAAVKDKDSALAKRVLNDVLVEVQRSIQFEPVGKAPLYRKLAEAFKALNKNKANRIIKDAAAPLLSE